MSNFDDEWMNDPLEMDDWIREMEEDTKGLQPKSGGKPPGGGGCGSGCLTVFLVVLAVTIIIAVIVTVFSPTYSSTTQRTANTKSTTMQKSKKCGVKGCDNLSILGKDYRYCYLHTCEELGCKDRVVNGSKFCSKHQPSQYGANNNKTTAERSTTKKSEDTYHASDYDDVDDFYEDNYNDFDGFDEAEAYWDENH